MQWKSLFSNGWYAGLFAGLVLGGVAAALAESAEDAAKRYEQCVTKTAQAPDAALAMADSWVKEKTTPAALHCRASALFALKRYTDAAIALQALGKAVQHQTPLWLSVQDQLSQAYMLAGKRGEALTVLNDTIKQAASKDLLAGNTILLINRARLFRQQKQPLKAVQDLDHAISLHPENDAFLLERARLYVEMNRKEDARGDANAILQRAPDNMQAKELLNGL